MTVARLAISIDADLARRVRKAAGRSTISAWLADAAARKLRADGLAEAVGEWESSEGAISDAELDKVARSQRRRTRR